MFHCLLTPTAAPPVLKHTALLDTLTRMRRALAEEQAARRAAAEAGAARARLARQYAQWSEDDEDGYGQHDYVYGLSPRERAYADVGRREGPF